MSRRKLKKYIGVYLNELSNGDINYSFTYKDLYNRTKWLTVGKKSAGITEAYVYKLRNKTISQVQLGEDPDTVKKKKRPKSDLMNSPITILQQKKESTGAIPGRSGNMNII